MTAEYPEFLWLDGERRRWNDATVHVSELGWSTVGAVFEGVRGYWDPAGEDLLVFRLREHLERLHRSMRLVRLPIEYSVDTLAEAIVDLLRANRCREDTYIFPLAYMKDSFRTRYDRPDIQATIHILTKPMPSHLESAPTMTARVS